MTDPIYRCPNCKDTRYVSYEDSRGRVFARKCPICTYREREDHNEE